MPHKPVCDEIDKLLDTLEGAVNWPDAARPAAEAAFRELRSANRNFRAYSHGMPGEKSPQQHKNDPR